MTEEPTALAAFDAALIDADDAFFDALLDADDAFFDALLEADAEALERLVADGFLIVDVAEGGIHGRAMFLGAVAAGLIAFESIERFHDEAIVREAGPETGVVVGRTKMAIAAPDGSRIEAASRYTHVFRREGELWRLISAQGTPIAEASA